MLAVSSLSDTPPDQARLVIPVMAPVSGKCGNLSAHENVLISQGIFGPGQLIYTASSLICSPVAGKMLTCDPLTYSYEVVSKKGLKLRVVFGDNMARLMGEKCDFLVREDAQVTSGQPVLRLNPAWLRQHQVTPVCAVTVINASSLKALVPAQARQLSAPEDVLFTVYA